MSYTFNGPAKTITIGGTGAVTITANDLYSRWVDWVHTGVGAGYDEVMRAIGGEDIGGGLTSGVYVFLSLGWSLVMPATITTLTVQGNVTRDPDDTSGAALYINQGAGLIIRELSAIALGYSSGSGGGATAAQVWAYSGRSLDGAQASALVGILEDTSTTIPGLIGALPTVAQVEAAGFTTTRHNALISAESAALAVADGRHVIDYANSTATQYEVTGTVRKVFELYDVDGNLATSPETAVERRPQP